MNGLCNAFLSFAIDVKHWVRIDAKSFVPVAHVCEGCLSQLQFQARYEAGLPDCTDCLLTGYVCLAQLWLLCTHTTGVSWKTLNAISCHPLLGVKLTAALPSMDFVEVVEVQGLTHDIRRCMCESAS